MHTTIFVKGLNLYFVHCSLCSDWKVSSDSLPRICNAVRGDAFAQASPRLFNFTSWLSDHRILVARI